MDPIQVSHSQPAASRRYVQRQPSSQKIRRQYVGRLLLDRRRPHNSAEEEGRPAPNVIFTEPPTGARRPRISAARSAAWRLLARRRRDRRPDPAFAKQESATAASRRRERVARLPVGAAPTRQGIKTSPKCQRESTAETPNVILTKPPH